MPEGSTFDIDVTSARGRHLLPEGPTAITEINNTGDAIIRGVRVHTGVDVTGPINVAVLCFATEGTTLGSHDGYTEQSDLAEGAAGTFSIGLNGNECPIGLALPPGTAPRDPWPRSPDPPVGAT